MPNTERLQPDINFLLVSQVGLLVPARSLRMLIVWKVRSDPLGQNRCDHGNLPTWGINQFEARELYLKPVHDKPVEPCARATHRRLWSLLNMDSTNHTLQQFCFKF